MSEIASSREQSSGEQIKTLAHIYSCIGSIVAKSKDEIFVIINVPAGEDAPEWLRSLQQSVPSINADIRNGVELLDRKNIGHQIRLPLSPEAWKALSTTIRDCAHGNVEVRVLPSGDDN